MISIKHYHGGITDIVLKRNQSATWLDNKRMLLIVFMTVSTIAAYWAWRGVWLVIPFAGLEIGLLIWFSYRVSHLSYQSQCIRFGERDIRIIDTINNHEKVFYSDACRLEAHQPKHSMSAERLILNDGFRRIELGSGLNKDDIDALKYVFNQKGVTIKPIGRIKINAIDGFEL